MNNTSAFIRVRLRIPDETEFRQITLNVFETFEDNFRLIAEENKFSFSSIEDYYLLYQVSPATIEFLDFTKTPFEQQIRSDDIIDLSKKMVPFSAGLVDNTFRSILIDLNSPLVENMNNFSRKTGIPDELIHEFSVRVVTSKGYEWLNEQVPLVLQDIPVESKLELRRVCYINKEGYKNLSGQPLSLLYLEERERLVSGALGEIMVEELIKLTALEKIILKDNFVLEDCLPESCFKGDNTIPDLLNRVEKIYSALVKSGVNEIAAKRQFIERIYELPAWNKLVYPIKIQDDNENGIIVFCDTSITLQTTKFRKELPFNTLKRIIQGDDGVFLSDNEQFEMFFSSSSSRDIVAVLFKYLFLLNMLDKVEFLRGASVFHDWILLHEKIIRIESINEELNSQITIKDKEVEETKTRLSIKENEFNEMSTSLNLSIDELQTDNIAKEQEIEELRSSVALKDEEINMLQKQLNETKEKANVSEQYDLKFKRLEMKENSLNRRTEELTRFEDELKKFHEEIMAKARKVGLVRDILVPFYNAEASENLNSKDIEKVVDEDGFVRGAKVTDE
eukprot:TRINITY_DN5177_c0_g1_i1.p1 TRINITY_DN5177_c0_g1~~TRINITY_DN5177_c0_g1_i1.p1  ORF type:complete len:564 (+),score=186.77 TRINITY_DN5177_c0_g1_i1:34-1725(+)